MERSEAIKIVAKSQLEKLTRDERSEQLEIMLFEDWTNREGWNHLPSDIQLEFTNDASLNRFLLNKSDDSKYDCVLLLWLENELKAVTNEYLLENLKNISNHVEEIEGKPIELVSCPCCGYCTLEVPGCYNICSVCWWNDDGQDNDDADTVMGGPNDSISLTKARYNFMTHGIYNPERKDLIKLKKPKEMFIKGRDFILKDENTITELGTNKVWKIDNNT